MRSGAMLLQDASVLHDEDAGLARFICCSIVPNTLLHPDGGGLQLDRLVDHLWHELRASKNVDDVDLSRSVRQRRASLFAEGTLDLRVYRDDLVSVGLHVGGNPVAG